MASSQRSLVIALVTGAASVVPIWRAPRAIRATVALGVGAAVGGAAFVGARVPEAFGETSDPVPPRPAAAIAVAAGGLMTAVTVAGIAMDRGAERFLVERGVRRPRLVLGVAGGVLSYAIDAIDRRLSTDD